MQRDEVLKHHRRLVEVTERKPPRVTTDKPPPYRRAIRWILGRKVVHRTNPYRNNLTEQDHRAVKQRYYPMLGFGSFASAARFCSAFEELRQYWRARVAAARASPGRAATTLRRALACTDRRKGGGVDRATVRGLHCASSVP